jgi:tRNA pseudouridine38-40 synthase
MRTLKLTIQYLGTRYHGWQIQPNGLTIQGIFQEILERLFHQKTVLSGAGRTDAGVHALAQVAHFRTDHPMDPATLQRALNANLPKDISVLSVEEVEPDFDAQRSSVAKTYTYLILNSPHPYPMLAPYTCRVYGSLELDDMHLCLEQLIGEHDFAAFQAADSTAKTSVRRLHAAALHAFRLQDFANGLIGSLGLGGLLPLMGEEDSFHPEEGGPGILAVHFRGEGFLKHMVRNIIGTILLVGRGKISVEDFRRIIASRDRTQAGPTAPPRGLFLVKVEY